MNDQEGDFNRLFLPEEIEAASYISKNHKHMIIDLPQGVLRFFNDSLGSLPTAKWDETSPMEKVCRVILGRLMQDIRPMTNSATFAYSAATASVAASIFEIAFESIYISTSEEAALEWINHKKVNKSPSDMHKRIGDYVSKMGFEGKEKNDMIEEYFSPYRIISMAKHGNSLLQRNMSIKPNKETTKYIVSTGPDTSDISMAVIAISLQHSLSIAMSALANFYKEFYPDRSENIISMADRTVFELTVSARAYPQLVFPD